MNYLGTLSVLFALFLSGVESSPQVSNLIENEDNNNARGHSNKKFIWQQHHQEDHGIYADRSLMSDENIKTDLDDEWKKSDKYEEHPLYTSDYAEKEWQLMFRSLDLSYDTTAGTFIEQLRRHTNFFEDIVDRLEPKCRSDIYHVRESMKKHKLWALRMLDSNGKLPSGLSYGRFSSPGDYEECLSVNINEVTYKPNGSDILLPTRHKFRGKYCLLDFRLPLPDRPRDRLLSVYEPVIDLSNTELGKQFPVIKNYSGYVAAFYEIGYLHAFCLPSSCDANDLAKSIGIALEGLHVLVNSTVDCEERFDEAQPLRTSQIISIIFLVLLFTNATLATIVQHYLSIRKKTNTNTKENEIDTNVGFRQRFTDFAERHNFYADCFSVQTNFQRLTRPDPRGLTFVHYTRIVAMALTVITHTAGLGTLQAVTKPADGSNSEQIFRDLLPQMLANAFTSIQIFFFMAGFMLVVSTYPQIKKEKGNISFLEYSIKRAIRLMPGIAATIALNFLWPLIVDGPMLTYFIARIVIPCESNWWKTMGFLSNFDHVEKMCLRHSYFSASDYQLHIIAFPLLLLLYKHPMLALSLAGLFTVGGFVSQIIMSLTKVLLPFMLMDYLIDKEAFFNVIHYIHHPVWNHMSSFFYGFIVGYMVVKQIRINMSDTAIKRTWWIIVPTGIVAIFAPYYWNHYKRPINKWQIVVYLFVDRFALLTTCAWLAYASMVLAVKPKKKPEPPKVHLELPEIISIQHQGKTCVTVNEQQPQKQSVDSLYNRKQSFSSSQDITKASDGTNVNQLSADTAYTGLPRQRSSPNMLSLVETGQQGIRSTVSSFDINSSQRHEIDATTNVPDKDTNVNSAQKRETKKSRAPISNVNTLCLVLSRLTFQLYLFNMVVLWVDVNHSKYYWFFSYYFIIMKAAAVYICSSLMAMVFFVTLESPCLALYIFWVKSRARAKANRRNQSDADNKFDGQQKEANLSEAQMKLGSSSSIINPNKSGDLHKLYLQTGTPTDTITKQPVFNYIDLSENQYQSQAANDTSNTNDQTKI